MAVLRELDFLCAGSEVPRHVSKETERKRELKERAVSLLVTKRSHRIPPLPHAQVPAWIRQEGHRSHLWWEAGGMGDIC